MVAFLEKPVFQGEKAGLRKKPTYHCHNSLYTTNALVSPAQGIVERYVYDPYGKVTVLDAQGVPKTDPAYSALGNGYTYTGRFLDRETGLYYFRYRYYDSNLGRFGGRDKLGFTDDLNQYSYVNNNSMKFFDPIGLKKECCGRKVYDDSTHDCCNPSISLIIDKKSECCIDKFRPVYPAVPFKAKAGELTLKNAEVGKGKLTKGVLKTIWDHKLPGKDKGPAKLVWDVSKVCDAEWKGKPCEKVANCTPYETPYLEYLLGVDVPLDPINVGLTPHPDHPFPKGWDCEFSPDRKTFSCSVPTTNLIMDNVEKLVSLKCDCSCSPNP